MPTVANGRYWTAARAKRTTSYRDCTEMPGVAKHFHRSPLPFSIEYGMLNTSLTCTFLKYTRRSYFSARRPCVIARVFFYDQSLCVISNCIKLEGSIIFSEEKDWTPKHVEVTQLLRSKKRGEEGIKLAIELHASVHFGEMSASGRVTYWDEVWDGLTDEQLSIMPTKKDETIAWCLWHTVRIEDLVSNLLMNEGTQILNDSWLKKLGVKVRDTGNAMRDSEIIAFSSQLNKQELRNYSNAVGRRTREILRALTVEDLGRKPKEESLQRLVSEGGLLHHRQSIWLKDFWGKKTIRGLILLPITRHHVMHLKDCFRMKDHIQCAAKEMP